MRRVLPIQLIGVVITVGCGQSNVYQTGTPPTVTVANPLQKTVTNYLEETGTTEAVAMVEVRARVRGFLEKVNFEAGADVKEGDVLYVIQQREFKAKAAARKAELAAQKVELTRAEIELARQKKLFEENATSEVNVVKAQAEHDSALAAIDAAQAALDQAELDLEYTEVKAPISGRVGKTLVKQGNLVGDNEATHLTTVISYDPIYANFNISESTLLQLKEEASDDEGRKIDKEEIPLHLRRAIDEGFDFPGYFDYADLAVAQSTGTFMLRGIFPNPNRDIVPGLFVRVRIPIGVQKDALLVPELALGSDQGGRFVLVVNSDNKVERRNIKPGARHSNLIVINQGLQPDDRVVVNGIQRARPGLEVTPEMTTLTLKEEEVKTVKKQSVEAKEGTPVKETPVKEPPVEETPTVQDEEKSQPTN
jgi:RND family efflux transporter MFP subunit